MTKRILLIVDALNGFMMKGCDLPVGANQEGAEELIPRMDSTHSKIRSGTFDYALVLKDTHFDLEYALSPESGPFPGIHCEYGTYGWQDSFNVNLIEGTPVFYMAKNVFNMWGENPVSVEKLCEHHGVSDFSELPFKSAAERQVYQNLFNVTDDPECRDSGVPRDEFLSGVGENTEIAVEGVATNFCDADAIYGFLTRGATVVVLSDLVKGIPMGQEGREALLAIEGIDRTVNGTIEELFATDRFVPFVAAGKLRAETSDEYLRRVQPEPAAPFPQF